MGEFMRRLRYLLNRGRRDRELADDMEFHREMAARAGNPSFGNVLRLREEARDAWGWTWIDRLSQDLSYAARLLQRSPGFSSVAVLMLALGIGVNVAAFGFFNLMVLRPLPVRDPSTLIHFQRRSPQGAADNFPCAEAAFFREHSKTLSAVLAASSAKLAVEGEEKQIDASLVTGNFLSELGAKATIGRVLDAGIDEAAAAEPVVVLGYGFWQRHFGRDPFIVGKTIRVSSKPVTVVGVVAQDFSGLGLDGPDLWAPIAQAPYLMGSKLLLVDYSDNGMAVQMWGRLRQGVTPRIAEDEMRALAAELHRQHPKETWIKETLPSEPGGYAVTVRNELYPLLVLAAALCLLILAAACVTLGSLLLAQGVVREREIAIRVSVGAGRTRLIRQLFTESLLLALLGSVAGLLLGYLALRGLMLWAQSPPWLSAAPDWRVVAFAIGAGLVAAIVFGLTPAWQIARQRHRASRMRQLLIAAQVAASCVLLIVSALLVRAVEHAVSSPAGFEYTQVISLYPNFQDYTPAKAHAYFDALRSRLSEMPGVASVSLASNPPLGNRWTVDRTRIAGRPVAIHFNNIDPQFFETMRIPLGRGRNLKRGDINSVVVSESLARLEWPGEDPIGKPFGTGTNATGAQIRDTVVGIAGNARLVSPEDSDAVEVYRLASENMFPSMVLLVRTSGPAEVLRASAVSAAKSIDPKLFPEAQLMKESFERKVQGAGYAALVVSLLGLMALLLACLGIVGLVAYAVAQRTKEIGIRMALGAKPVQVLAIVLRQFSLPVVAGLVVGAGGAAGLSQILRRELYGVSNLDAMAYLCAIAVFLLAAGLAALWPARAALRVDPMRALRYD